MAQLEVVNSQTAPLNHQGTTYSNGNQAELTFYQRSCFDVSVFMLQHM